MKAGIVKDISEYKWSNYQEYVSGSTFLNPSVNYVLGIFHTSRKEALSRFVEFIQKPNEDVLLDRKDNQRMTDADAEMIIKNVCKLEHAFDLQKVDIQHRNESLRKLRKYNMSIRQIERLTGINRGVILKAK